MTILKETGAFLQHSARLFLLPFSILLSVAGNPEPPPPWEDRGWLRLMHYRYDRGGFVSAVENSEFFLHPDGRFDPEKEWIFAKNVLFSEEKSFHDHHPRCRFPARSLFLSRQLNRPLPSADCSNFDNWKAKVSSEVVSLVHAAQYTGNPASFFGHTFLKFHSESMKFGTKDLYMLDPSFGFFASIGENTSTFDYVFKGLTGGFTGQFIGSTFHQHIYEYGSIENRALWEYELDLNPDQVSFLLNHIWELWGSATFPYFYLDENCSYRLLTVLEAVRPDWEFSSAFPSFVIPSETVRVIYENSAVRAIRHRPSAFDWLMATYEEMSQEEQWQFLGLASGTKKVAQVSDPLVLEGWARWIEQQQTKNRGKLSPELFADLGQTLKKRASLGTTERDVSIPVNLSNGVHNSHGPSLISLQRGKGFDEGWYGQLSLRPALHALTDPSQAYSPGSEIEFLNLSVRVSDESRMPDLHSLTVVSVKNLETWHPVQLRPAFGVSLGFGGMDSRICGACNFWTARGLLGSGFSPGTDWLSLFILPEVLLERPVSAKEKGYLGAGFQLAALVNRQGRFKAYMGADALWSGGLSTSPEMEKAWFAKFNLELSRALSFAGRYDFREGMGRGFNTGLAYYF